jgi:hypothetical protein
MDQTSTDQADSEFQEKEAGGGAPMAPVQPALDTLAGPPPVTSAAILPPPIALSLELTKPASQRSAPDIGAMVPTLPQRENVGRSSRGQAVRTVRSETAPTEKFPSNANGGDVPESESDSDEDKSWERVLLAAPSWLASLVAHLVILLGLACIFLTQEKKGTFNINAEFASRRGEQLDDMTLDIASLEDTNAKEPEWSPEPSDPIEAPFAAPPEIDLTSDMGLLSSKIQAPHVGAALRGREVGFKQALLRSMGGTEETEAAVQMALEWLQRNQKANGGWSLKGPYSDGARTENHAAATAMALLAFQGTGNTHHYGEFQHCVEKGYRHLLKLEDKNGNFYHDSDRTHRPYAQAMATMAICELYAMSKDPALKEPAQRAVDFAIKTQGLEGGWRYDPRSDSDTSVTGWFLMAMQSARMGGLEVPSPVFENISNFLELVAVEGGAQYVYEPSKVIPSPAMTAEAILCRQYLGWRRDDPRMLDAISYLQRYPMEWRQRNTYYWYYATQVFHHFGGDPWYQWNSVMRDLLPRHQEKVGKDRGSWTNEGDLWGAYGGRLFSTCMSVYMLEVYYRHMPLYANIYEGIGEAAPPKD